MALRSEFVELLAEKVTGDLLEREYIEVPDDFSVTETIFQALNNEITIEEKLNNEVRLLLNDYGNQMRESGASYQEMFKLVKKKLARERKLVL